MIRIHPSADVSSQATIGEDTQIWHQAQVREGAHIGRQCIVGKGVYVDFDVRIGDCCKLQNGASLYHGGTLDDGVFVGPGVILTNDRFPRAINPDGSLKGADDWNVGLIHVCHGAALGAGCIVLPNVTIGEFATVGAGAVVTHSVPNYGLVIGAPARLVGYVCRCGQKLAREDHPQGAESYRCAVCQQTYHLSTGEQLRIQGDDSP